MLNQSIVVGRLVDKPRLITDENGKKKSMITVAVPRSYKNANGDYETDFVDCILWAGIAESTVEYCMKGDILGIKGHIEIDYVEKNGENIKVTNLVAEKVSFLSSNKNSSDNNGTN